MSTGQTPPELIALPLKSGITLTPELWLALGVASYNHALLAKRPLRVLAPEELVIDLSTARRDALQRGLAAITDVSLLSPSSLNATVRITRTLLEPLGVEVTLFGNPEGRSYLLLEFVESSTVRQPRIMPAHGYPPSEGGDPGTEAHRKAQAEAEALDTQLDRAKIAG